MALAKKRSHYSLRSLAPADFDEDTKRRREECYIDNLTDDCLTHVFHRIDWLDRVRCEGVCRRWNRVVKARGWAKFHVFDHNEDPPMETRHFPVLRSRGFTLPLQELTITGAMGDNIRNTLLKCPNARHLRLRPYDGENFRRDFIPLAVQRRLVTLEIHVSLNFCPHWQPISLVTRR
jgi:hypothetical protein